MPTLRGIPTSVGPVSGLAPSTVIVGALMAGFVFFLAARNRLAVYCVIFTGGQAAGGATTGAGTAGGSSAGNVTTVTGTPGTSVTTTVTPTIPFLGYTSDPAYQTGLPSSIDIEGTLPQLGL